MNQRSIQTDIQSSMKDKGWLLRSVCGLSPAFVRDSLVTPYFHCSQIRRTARGSYVIEGVIGVIHEDFEKSWNKHSMKDMRVPGFGVILDIANVRELSEKSWIKPDADASAVESFCSAVTEILERMPCCQDDLVKAFQESKLYKMPVDQFAGFAHREKFYAFKEFVRSLQKNPTSG